MSRILHLASRSRPLTGCILYLASCLLCPAATITGNLQTITGTAYVTNLVFAPRSTPLALGAVTVASVATNIVCDANGAFTVTLKQGDYLVTIGNMRHDSFAIAVPADDNTYNLNSLVTSAVTYAFPFSPIYEQQSSRGQAGGYVGLNGLVLSPPGLVASNFNLLGPISLGMDAGHYGTFYVNENSSVYVQPGGGVTLDGDTSLRAELWLHGTNAFVRFDEDAGINDSTASRVWKFNRFNITGDNVATLLEATNIAQAVVAAGGGTGGGGPSTSNNIPVGLSYSGTNVNINADVGTVFRLILTANTGFTITGGCDGEAITVGLTQDGVGNRTVALTNLFFFGGDITGVMLTTNAGKTDYLRAQYWAASNRWEVLGWVRGY